LLRAVTALTLPNSHALLRRDPLPREFTVFFGFAGPARRRYEDHPLALEAHTAHLRSRPRKWCSVDEEFVPDSPLEGTGFEPLVPPDRYTR
jgi:hypothetical protein